MTKKSKVWSLESGVSRDGVRPSPGAAVWRGRGLLELFKTIVRADVAAPGDGRTPLNAYADLLPQQRRVERRAVAPEPTAFFRIVRPTTFDGDKSAAESGDQSPHSKGFAASLAGRYFERPRLLQTRDFRLQTSAFFPA